MTEAYFSTVMTQFLIVYGVIFGIWLITGIVLAVVFLLVDKKKKQKLQEADSVEISNIGER